MPRIDELLSRAVQETDYARFPGGLKKLRALIGELLDRPPRRLLDVGCGNGALAFPMAALGYEVVGVDIDRASIAECRSRNRFPHARFVVTEGRLEEVEGTFDLVLCSEVLEHLDDPAGLVTAMCEKLAQRGRLFITVPNGYGAREIGGRLERRLREDCGLDRVFAAARRELRRCGMPDEREKYRMHTSNPDQGHVQKFTRRRLIALLGSAGLEVTRWTNSFVILSVFHSRLGSSTIERLDEWAADRLPAALASGWYVACERRRPAEVLLPPAKPMH